MSWWVHDYYQSGLIVLLISHIFWVILSITLHELAHGWAALWQGDDTPRRLGHLTLNPLMHMGAMSLLALALVGIAWGAMPVDPSRFRWRRRGRIVVAGAGPAMNLLLAIFCVIALALWVRFGPAQAGGGGGGGAGDGEMWRNIAWFFFIGAELNLVLFAFNLLPVPPLDGANILSGLSFRAYLFFQRANAQMLGMLLVIALMVSGLGGFVWVGGAAAAMALTDLAGSVLGNPPVREWLGFGY